MKLKLGKRAEGAGEEISGLTIYGMMSIIFLTALVFVTIFFAASFKANILYTPSNLERDLLISRFLYSPSCFVYYDGEIMRPYPLVIDLHKFDENNLNSCMRSRLDFRLTLSYGNFKNIIKTENWNNNPAESIVKELLVFEDGILKKASLLIEIEGEE